MLTTLRGLGTKFLSWAVGEGGRTMAKQAAVKGATQQAVVGVQKTKDTIDDLTNKGYDSVTGRKSGTTLANLERGQKKMGFFGSLGVSVLIGVGVSFLIPGAGFIAVGIIQGIGTTAVEAGVGALTDDETPTPTPKPLPTRQPVLTEEENPYPLSGTDPEPEPVATPFVYTNVTAAPHEPDPEPCDSDDPHGGCYVPPHEEDPEH